MFHTTVCLTVCQISQKYEWISARCGERMGREQRRSLLCFGLDLDKGAFFLISSFNIAFFSVLNNLSILVSERAGVTVSTV